MRTDVARPSAAPRPDADRGRALALAVLAAASAVAWWPAFGAPTLWAAVPVAVAVAVAARALRVRTAVVALAAWLPTGLLLAGVPLGELRPGRWDDATTALARGADVLRSPGRDPVSGDPWPLAAALLVAGTAWLVAAALTRVPGRIATAVALALPALPLVWALALEQTSDAAWPGAALLAAAVLWTARGRLAALVPATAVVAAVAAVGGHALAPEEQWIPFVEAGDRKPQFTRLDTAQSYGPLPDRRTGRTMLEIDAPAPALWRMQVLERFDGGRWSVRMRPRPDLSQPRAVPEDATVRVEGLRDRLVVAPGRVTAVDDDPEADREPGEARELEDEPRKGDEYRVTSEVVRASAEELEDVPIPAPGIYADYTRIWGGGAIRRGGRPAIELVDQAPSQYASTDFMRVLTIAARLADGEPTQLELVRRVQRFLVDSGRFTYTTEVPDAGARPLFDFLLRDRAGYCQQFAGAAALLLRMAGVPTRVVTGFATGEESGDGTFVVRDQDAHAWIEVYFPGSGWVPFNPTPADAEATVDASLDVLAPPTATGGGGGGGGGALLLVPVVAGGGLVVWRLRSRRRDPAAEPAVPTGELLARLAPGTVGPGTTLTSLQIRLSGIGPATAALADEIERARYAGNEGTPDRRPRLRVWRALRADVGTARATMMLARHGVRRPTDA